MGLGNGERTLNVNGKKFVKREFGVAGNSTLRWYVLYKPTNLPFFPSCLPLSIQYANNFSFPQPVLFYVF